ARTRGRWRLHVPRAPARRFLRHTQGSGTVLGPDVLLLAALSDEESRLAPESLGCIVDQPEVEASDVPFFPTGTDRGVDNNGHFDRATGWNDEVVRATIRRILANLDANRATRHAPQPGLAPSPNVIHPPQVCTEDVSELFDERRQFAGNK